MRTFGRIALVCGAMLSMSVAQATFFTNFVFSGSLSAGISETNLGNSISFTIPNAAVGDPGLASTRSGGFTIQYDAFGGAFTGDVIQINSTSLGAILGSGVIVFTEDIFALDNNGNELGSPIGHVTQILDAESPSWSSTLNFSAPAENIRAKKSFTLLAPDSLDPAVVDYASVQLVNQNLVPEPASLAALGIGALALIRRRRARK